METRSHFSDKVISFSGPFPTLKQTAFVRLAIQNFRHTDFAAFLHQFRIRLPVFLCAGIFLVWPTPVAILWPISEA